MENQDRREGSSVLARTKFQSELMIFKGVAGGWL